ncbi:MAG: 5-formyltetrahydrofolate cyclo-ligase [Cardiobacteriaceae bacterium]|nr:5-formyltetrahydrofolate cyclo-ligase [Cardiobacteriaceae bacterium]
MPDKTSNIADIRRDKRAVRRNLAQDLRANYSRKAALFADKFIEQLLKIRPNPISVGIFLSLPEEIDTSFLLEKLRARNVEIFLPAVIDKNSPLAWRKFDAPCEFEQDAMKIPTPCGKNHPLPDLVFAPLTVFDETGTRIGMGGGFYDRSFALYTQNNCQNRKNNSPKFSTVDDIFYNYLANLPQKIFCGYAYSFQKENSPLPRQNWDIPLDCLITEKEIYIFE